MSYGEQIYGLRDVKLTDITGSTQVDLPAARTFAFKEMLNTNQLRGDDSIKAVVTITDAAEWSLENGGIPLAAWEIMTGRTAVEAGTTPTRTNTFTASAGDCMPYFKVYGKAVGENCTDDVHVLLFKCKLIAPLEGQFADGEFYVTSSSGIAIDDGSNGIYDIVQNETADDLPTS